MKNQFESDMAQAMSEPARAIPSCFLLFTIIIMSKFNSKSSTKTENLAGGEAFSESPKLEFVSLLLTSFVSDQFYRGASDTLSRMEKLIDSIKDKTFVAKAAIYARTKFGMRSISHAVAGEVAKRVKGETWTRRFYEKVVYRPDDITEILSYYLNKYKKPIPNSLKKGLALALKKFDAYSLGKYRGERREVKMVDVVNIVHPFPSDKNSDALKKLVKGELKSTDTWESKLTQAGQEAEGEEEKAELKKGAWKELVKERKLGYFALLRNLRNIAVQAPEVLPDALKMLTDKNLIKKSLVLPFRFMTAKNELEKVSSSRKILEAISDAADIAVDNVPRLKGRTLIALDVSGSMSGKPATIAALFAAVLYKSNDADLLTFDNKAEYKNLNSRDSVLSLASGIPFTGGGTDFHTIFETADKPYDRIVILSDMQGWVNYIAPQGSFTAYKKKTGASPVLYSFDLQGYGTLQFPEKNVYCLAGFSEKIFDVMQLLEEDRNALIHEIEKIEL